MKHWFSMLKKGDLLLIAAVLLLAFGILVFFFFDNSEKKRCIITQNHVIMSTIELTDSDSQTITLEGDYETVVEVVQGRVRVLSSTCPNQQCVHTGWISRSGQSIICLPNQILIRIESNREAEVDAVAN